MVEHNNLTGTNVAPEIAVNVKLAPEHVIRLGISKALRDPTLFEENLQTIVIGPSGIPILVPVASSRRASFPRKRVTSVSSPASMPPSKSRYSATGCTT
jgi:hypothetical protein